MLFTWDSTVLLSVQNGSRRQGLWRFFPKPKDVPPRPLCSPQWEALAQAWGGLALLVCVYSSPRRPSFSPWLSHKLIALGHWTSMFLLPARDPRNHTHTQAVRTDPPALPFSWFAPFSNLVKSIHKLRNVKQRGCETETWLPWHFYPEISLWSLNSDECSGVSFYQ